jgi:hypothetical protein
VREKQKYLTKKNNKKGFVLRIFPILMIYQKKEPSNPLFGPNIFYLMGQ